MWLPFQTPIVLLLAHKEQACCAEGMIVHTAGAKIRFAPTQHSSGQTESLHVV